MDDCFTSLPNLLLAAITSQTLNNVIIAYHLRQQTERSIKNNNKCFSKKHPAIRSAVDAQISTIPGAIAPKVEEDLSRDVVEPLCKISRRSVKLRLRNPLLSKKRKKGWVKLSRPYYSMAGWQTNQTELILVFLLVVCREGRSALLISRRILTWLWLSAR